MTPRLLSSKRPGCSSPIVLKARVRSSQQRGVGVATKGIPGPDCATKSLDFFPTKGISDRDDDKVRGESLSLEHEAGVLNAFETEISLRKVIE